MDGAHVAKVRRFNRLVTLRAGALHEGVEGFRPPRGTFLVGRIEERPVGCGGFTRSAADVAYIKRMWVDSSVRGLGLGRRMLEALEDAAAQMGCSRVQLETNRALTVAIRLYRSAGYEEVEPFNDELYADHWFEKPIEPVRDA